MEAHYIFTGAVLAVLLGIAIALWMDARPRQPERDPYQEPWQ